jgi:hypothetical protein
MLIVGSADSAKEFPPDLAIELAAPFVMPVFQLQLQELHEHVHEPQVPAARVDTSGTDRTSHDIRSPLEVDECLGI